MVQPLPLANLTLPNCMVMLLNWDAQQKKETQPTDDQNSR